MLKVLVLLKHRRFVDVIVGRDTMIARVFGKPAYIVGVIATNVDVEKHHVAVDILFSQQMFEMLADRHDRLGQTRLLVPCIDGKIEDRGSRISETVSDIGPEQTRIGSDVNPEPLLCCVVDNLVRKLRAQQRFSTHERKHPAAVVVEPIDRPPRDIFRHALHFVIKGPAVPAIKIALVFDKKISSDGMKLTWQNPRPHVWVKPAAHRAIHLRHTPITLTRRYIRTGVVEFLRVLWEHRVRQCEALRLRYQDRTWLRIHQQVVNVDIDTEFRGSGHADTPPRLWRLLGWINSNTSWFHEISKKLREGCETCGASDKTLLVSRHTLCLSLQG